MGRAVASWASPVGLQLNGLSTFDQFASLLFKRKKLVLLTKNVNKKYVMQY